MPRVNIYIRNEDWAKWEAIENKPEWLHNALVAGDIGKTLYPMPKGKNISQLLGDVKIDDTTAVQEYAPAEETA